MFIRKSGLMLALLTLALFALGLARQYQAGASRQRRRMAFRWPEGKRGAISLSFDDARPSQVDNGVAAPGSLSRPCDFLCLS